MDIVLIGTSGLLYRCAEKISEYYHGEKKITVFDTDRTSVNKHIHSLFSVVYWSEQEIMNCLQATETNTVVFCINNCYPIPVYIRDNPSLTFICLHYSLLPSHPQRHAEAWTIFDGDEYGGITWYQLDSGSDAIRIIKQVPVRITETMRSFDLLRSCDSLAIETLSSFLPDENTPELTGLDQAGKVCGTIHSAIQIPGDGELDLTWSAEKISRFLRAMDYGGTFPLDRPCIRINGREMLILRYSIENNETNAGGKSIFINPDLDSVTIFDSSLQIRFIVCDKESISVIRNTDLLKNSIFDKNISICNCYWNNDYVNLAVRNNNILGVTGTGKGRGWLFQTAGRNQLYYMVYNDACKLSMPSALVYVAEIIYIDSAAEKHDSERLFLSNNGFVLQEYVRMMNIRNFGTEHKLPDNQQIRYAGPNDYELIQQLFCNCFDETTDAVPVDNNLLDSVLSGKILLCEDTKKGVAGCAMLDITGTKAWIRHVAVEASSRRHGIATALVSHLISNEGITECSLWIKEGNKEAKRLYDKLGFRTTNRIMEIWVKKPDPKLYRKEDKNDGKAAGNTEWNPS